MTELIPHARSAGVRNPRLYMFDAPSTDLSMNARRWVKVNPFNTGINPVTFQIDLQDDFLDLTESEFEVEIQIKQPDGGNLVTADVVALVNNLIHTLFKQINVRLNSTLISPQTDTYHLRAFIETVLNYDRDDGETLLAPAAWYNDINTYDDGEGQDMTINKFNTNHNDYKALPEGRKNMVQSRLQFLDGKKVTLRFKPFLEVFHLSKLLVPGVQIQMEMYFNDPDMWTIRWTGADSLRLTEAEVNVRFFLCQVKVKSSIYR